MWHSTLVSFGFQIQPAGLRSEITWYQIFFCINLKHPGQKGLQNSNINCGWPLDSDTLTHSWQSVAGHRAIVILDRLMWTVSSWSFTADESRSGLQATTGQTSYLQCFWPYVRPAEDTFLKVSSRKKETDDGLISKIGD